MHTGKNSSAKLFGRSAQAEILEGALADARVAHVAAIWRRLFCPCFMKRSSMQVPPFARPVKALQSAHLCSVDPESLLGGSNMLIWDDPSGICAKPFAKS